MNKGTDLIQRTHGEIIDQYPTGNMYIGVTHEEYEELNSELEQWEKYKAIEEELGIGLITLFKAIRSGVWVRNEEQGVHFISMINWTCEVSKIVNELKPLYFFSVWEGNEEDADDTTYFIKDYGKTWALTEEELE